MAEKTAGFVIECPDGQRYVKTDFGLGTSGGTVWTTLPEHARVFETAEQAERVRAHNADIVVCGTKTAFFCWRSREASVKPVGAPAEGGVSADKRKTFEAAGRGRT